MPAMNAFTVDEAGTIAGNFFFRTFNHSGSISALPAGSFDTSNITTVGSNFFDSFVRENSILTALPAGSFNTSNITTIGSSFFSYFAFKNTYLTALPAGSFNTNGIPIGAYSNFFVSFNQKGKLKKVTSGGVPIINKDSGARTFYYLDGSTNKTESVPSGGTFRYNTS
jgi:hypothetical protein